MNVPVATLFEASLLNMLQRWSVLSGRKSKREKKKKNERNFPVSAWIAIAFYRWTNLWNFSQNKSCMIIPDANGYMHISWWKTKIPVNLMQLFARLTKSHWLHYGKIKSFLSFQNLRCLWVYVLYFCIFFRHVFMFCNAIICLEVRKTIFLWKEQENCFLIWQRQL